MLSFAFSPSHFWPYVNNQRELPRGNVAKKSLVIFPILALFKRPYSKTVTLGW